MALNVIDGCTFISEASYEDGAGWGNVAVKIGDGDWITITMSNGVMVNNTVECNDFDTYAIQLDVTPGETIQYKYISELGELMTDQTDITLEQTGPVPPFISSPVGTPLTFTGTYPEPDVGTIELTTENINDGKITLNWEDIEGTS